MMRSMLRPGRAGFDPRTYGGLKLWLDAHRGWDNSAFSWTDIANGYVMGAGVSHPTWSATGWDSSHPGVSFSSGKYLINNSDAALYDMTNTSCTFTAIARINTTSNSAYQALLSWTDVPATNQFLIFNNSPSSVSGVAFSSGSLVAGSINSTGKKTLAFMCDNSTVDLWVDKVSAASSAFGGNTSSASRILLGLDGLFSAAPLTATIGEVLLFNKRLTDAQVTAISDYLTARWP